MDKRWAEIAEWADFKEIGRRFGIDQVTARLLVNRGVREELPIREYLEGGITDLPDPHLLKDGDAAAEILEQKIREGAHIRIIGDYDIDGVMSTYILKRALLRLGARVSAAIPHRVEDGYGLNERLIRRAREDGVDTILTCDNGIAAMKEIALAKDCGMTVVVTDHHAIPYDQGDDGSRQFRLVPADAVVNPHRPDCGYPFKELCGAAVAWKLVCLLDERMGLDRGSADEFLEFVAFATVGDIMPLLGENRILVRAGLSAIKTTANIGLLALIRSCGLDQDKILAYHFGFVLGPCINAAGRLDSAEKALALLFEEDRQKALEQAQELVALNEQRKTMTEDGVRAAVELCEKESYGREPVLVLYIPQIHESIAGIVAGRIRERYYKPTFILTDSQDFVKGSGRSVEEYSMYDEMSRCKELFLKYGGHPAAAGLSLAREKVPEFRERINELCPPECRNLVETLRFDVRMPIGYITPELVREFERLEPFGKDNPRPSFAEKNLRIRRMRRIGSEGTGMKLWLESEQGGAVEGVCFRGADVLEQYITDRFGKDELKRALWGMESSVRLSVFYHPSINSYGGRERLQIIIEDYQYTG